MVQEWEASKGVEQEDRRRVRKECHSLSNTNSATIGVQEQKGKEECTQLMEVWRLVQQRGIKYWCRKEPDELCMISNTVESFKKTM